MTSRASVGVYYNPHAEYRKSKLGPPAQYALAFRDCVVLVWERGGVMCLEGHHGLNGDWKERTRGE